MDNFIEIQHASLIVSNTETSLAFYCDILGMSLADRADLDFPGAWLQVGNQQIHLLELANPDPTTGRPEHGGRDRHTAIVVNHLDSIKRALDDSSVAYTNSRSGRLALFVRDPDGNTLEIIQGQSL